MYGTETLSNSHGSDRFLLLSTVLAAQHLARLAQNPLLQSVTGPLFRTVPPQTCFVVAQAVKNSRGEMVTECLSEVFLGLEVQV